jgi:hypothetical protein
MSRGGGFSSRTTVILMNWGRFSMASYRTSGIYVT